MPSSTLTSNYYLSVVRYFITGIEHVRNINVSGLHVFTRYACMCASFELRVCTRNFIAFVNIAGSAYTKIWSLMQDFAGMQPSCVHKRYEITSTRILVDSRST
jgi:hypothetical protein